MNNHPVPGFDPLKQHGNRSITHREDIQVGILCDHFRFRDVTGPKPPGKSFAGGFRPVVNLYNVVTFLTDGHGKINSQPAGAKDYNLPDSGF
jgi:hypothetical protein